MLTPTSSNCEPSLHAPPAEDSAADWVEAALPAEALARGGHGSGQAWAQPGEASVSPAKPAVGVGPAPRAPKDRGGAVGRVSERALAPSTSTA